ncbi:hypothetical protein L6452_35610 [Arctium lappa]|uniref:Uncharacterized protein n=1 Tax=Arctium lappa TaxID=4217 RepID=A0ACB8Y7K0_ARCLA|nr:hypothetical protein L6452_35610 [Arctium lappa]
MERSKLGQGDEEMERSNLGQVDCAADGGLINGEGDDEAGGGEPRRMSDDDGEGGGGGPRRMSEGDDRKTKWVVMGRPD